MTDSSKTSVKLTLIVAVVLVLLLTGAAGLWIPGLQLIVHLLTGWFRHFVVNAPHLGWNPATVALGVFCALAATWLTHRFIKSLRGGPWAPRQTVLAVGLFLAATAAAVGMTGIVHELAWLARTPILQNNRATDRTYAIINGKQLHLVLLEANLEGRHPTTLEELVEFDFIDPESFADLAAYQVPGSKIEERFVLLQPGRDAFSIPTEVPVLAAFGFPENRCVVVFNDASARHLSTDELDRLLDEQPWDSPDRQEE
jgi:hypothetical protein